MSEEDIALPALPDGAGRSLVRDVAATALTRVAGIVSGVVTLTFTTRLLGPQGRGQFAVAMATLGLVLQFCNLGLHSSATYHLSRRSAERVEVISALALYSIVGVGAVALLASLLIWRMPALMPDVPFQIVWLALLAAPPAMFILLAGSAWLGLGAPAWYNGLDLGTKAIGLVSVAVLLIGPLSGFFLVYAACHGALALYAYSRLVGWTWTVPSSGVTRDLVTFGVRAFIVNLSMFLILRQDLFLVNAWLGTADAGRYSVAVQVSELLLLAAASITAMLFPRLASMPPSDRWILARSAGWWTAGGLAIGAGLLGLVGRPLFSAAFGAEYVPALVAFWLLLPGLWCLGINSVLMQYLAACGMPWFVPLTTIAGVVVNGLLNVWLIPWYGINGAATASSLTYAALLATSSGYLWTQPGSVTQSVVTRNRS
ncbi:MAG TPA: oligosaccharide flippase family protein [Chloroflexota bacterium]|nr:oligosaccharide flippase family protein [Chloroflexota bacterium]